MNEVTESKVTEETAPAAAEQQESGGEMPPEERAQHAARRRAAEQKAKELRSNAREERLKQEVLSHPLVREAMTLLEETRFRQDLAEVRQAYPELTAERPEEVGEVYCRLMASGTVDPVVAYEAQLAATRRLEPMPDDMVSARSQGGAALYYSSQELDRLTARDLRDPNIFRKAMESLKKLKV